MFGKPVPSEAWERKLRTVHGNAIYDALRMFHERPIDLAPPATDLGPGLIDELKRIGVTGVTGVTTIPLGGLLAPTNGLHDRVRTFIRADIANAVRRCLDSGLDDHVRDWAKSQLEAAGPDDDDGFIEIIDSVSQTVASPAARNLEKAYPSVFSVTHEMMPFHLLGVLIYQVAFLAKGMNGPAEALGRIADRFLAGNFPLGILQDGTYAVLVI